jgi:hypothetical protein
VLDIIKRGLAITSLTGICVLAAAPAALASTNIQAFGVSVNLANIAAVGPTPLANLSNPNASLASITAGPVSTRTLTASVTQNTTSAPGTESSTATTHNLSATLLTLGITASVITATCTATQGQNTTGSVNLANLVIPGVTVPVNPAPNTVLTLPLSLGTITLNEQTPASPGTGQLTVNAIHIRALPILNGGGDIIISSATCGAAPVVNGVPVASGAGLYLGGAALAGLAFTVSRVRRRNRNQS